MGINDKELVNKVIDLCLIYGIKDSQLYMEFLDNQIKFYRTELNFIKDN